MLSNSTGTAGPNDGENVFPSFPESKWESFNSALAPISVLGLITFAILHYKTDPFLSSIQRIRPIIYVIGLVYLIPFSLIMGSSNDGAMIGLLVASAVIEIAINSYLFIKNQQHKICTRAGSRILFISMCIFIGASMSTDEYNRIDYYGPVRVTDVKLEMYRPEQQIDKFNPKYYYYYQLEQTLEWGDSWGCPSQKSERWCSTNEDLYKSECRVRIDCQGGDYLELGECATTQQKEKAFTDLLLCWAGTASNEGLHLDDFTNTNFTRAVAPWDDSSNPHTVTRSVTCDKACGAQDTVTPEQLADEAFLYWVVGGVMALMGCAALSWGIKHDQVVHQVGFRPVPASVVWRTAPMSEASVANDLELSSNYMPSVAQAVPA